jgi:A/G-specific adenine glycosylase
MTTKAKKSTKPRDSGTSSASSAANQSDRSPLASKTTRNSQPAPFVPGFDTTAFQARLSSWYSQYARQLPWRESADPYRIWVSEVMLQQTRVNAVIEHYHNFLGRFPTLVALALAPESDVLAAWSGLGYYRRARMLHKAAQFILTERNGELPLTAEELRTLPGIGGYTAAAIASIAFGEHIPVVDGNVERVIFRITGRVADSTAATTTFIHSLALALLPQVQPSGAEGILPHSQTRELPSVTVGHDDELWPEPTGNSRQKNPVGDHNQAMMELGATVCLPRAPLCLTCPVYEFCLTRGEHVTPKRPPLRSQPFACLLHIRKRGPVTEVLLERRPEGASLMPSMYELPQLSLQVVEGREPILRLRHSITNTNYYVQVFAPRGTFVDGNTLGEPDTTDASLLSDTLVEVTDRLQWIRASLLGTLPLTGLTRKILQRLEVMESPRIALLEDS